VSAAASRFARRYGPWAVVTGASDGIGRAFAQALAQRGLHLLLVARRQAVLQGLADALQRTHGVQCRVVAADLSDPQAVHHLAQATAELDVGLLVASAGFGSSGPLLNSPLGVETEMVAVNCTAVLALAWHYGRRMAARNSGGVVFMSSLLAFHGTPRAANDAATKAYVQTLAEGLRVEWAAQGVDVIASAPGPIKSGFDARSNMRFTQAVPADVVARVTLQALGRKTTVRPGWLSKLLGWSLAMLPRWGQVIVITQVMKGRTAHQRQPGEGSPAR
jgi:uncharacterized protein